MLLRSSRWPRMRSEGGRVAERVVVVGAGIVGSAMAYSLAARGVDVVLVDSAPPGTGATGASFGWIGRTAARTLPSASLRMHAVDDWRTLEREVPGLRIDWSGSICWGSCDDGSGERVDAAELEPRLRNPPPAARLHPDDGAVDPRAASERLVDAARARGARVRLGDPVLALERRGDAVAGVRTAAGTIPATTVVLAAGVGAPALCRAVGAELPLRSDPAVLVRLQADEVLVRSIVASDELEIRQDPTGTLLVPLSYAGEDGQEALMATARSAAARVRSAFSSAEGVRIVSAAIGWRPMPSDGEPVIGRVDGVPGLYIAVMHSGVTLAASAGRLAAEEIVSGRDSPDLAGCRLDRFG
jgi:glycine/D-amino acid oxidase-like deaminating enzyme